MTKKPSRTRPLDRDGDGKDGGSLPGNQTAPMAKGNQDPQPSSDDASPSDDASEASDTEAVAAASEASGDVAAETDTDGDATFTAEEIAAGQTTVVEQEGEATATDADQATQLAETDPLATVETNKAPIAVHLSDLQKLTSARRLYHTREGYSATWNAPFLDAATVDGWVAAGLAEALPTAGNTGGVRATDEARKLERQLRREQAQAA